VKKKLLGSSRKCYFDSKKQSYLENIDIGMAFPCCASTARKLSKGNKI